MITNVILILYNRSINNKLILRYLHFRPHIACFCSISPTKKLLQTTTVLICVSDQHESDSFLNYSIVYMIQFNHSDSLITSDFQPPTGEFNFTFKVYFRFKNFKIECLQMRLYINRPNLQHNQSMPINKKAQNWPINRLISTPDQA